MTEWHVAGHSEDRLVLNGLKDFIMKKGMFYVLAALILLGSIGLLQRLRSLAAPPADVESTYLTEGNDASHSKTACVVFVHGIFGDDSTWGKGDLTLPKLLGTDPQLASQLDIFLFEYSSPYLGNASKISDLAEQLRGALEDHHVWDHKKVIFVAHSMGGLVVREYIAAHREHVLQVVMLYLYAVPTNGAVVAGIARTLSHNPQLSGMLPLEGNDFLNSIQNTWRESTELRRIPTYCGFENAPTDGVWIVPEGSAVALCDSTDPLVGDHIQIVKPRSRSDPRFTRLATAITKSISEPQKPPRSSNPLPEANPSMQIGTINQTVQGGTAIAGVQGSVNVSPKRPRGANH